ncbi:MAG: M81 family metallopeptidase [Bosea sp.]|uniref:M81 family metallopeptidase n=1 Tax=Bosea sp. (in: a-proteobacteria) TaxID=1871050 RepID=UPI001ACB1219|nr:M81 family metallopeptidase [Bosea sp. (in: a-proteobacteria)]MBN9450330.1 M81 family metallopeptidase [Bosea sp. (in: a-proteobacteria)]
MRRVLVTGCEQEISSFNPLASQYADFTILRGPDVFKAHAGADSCIHGFLDVLGRRPDLELVPAYAASACSAGPLSADGFDRIRHELLEAVRENAQDLSAVYVSLHGAMGALNEADPEGALLEGVRGIVGPDVPIVISLDLHGVVTARMLRNCDAAAVFHTYPHNDFTGTGRRAARLLARILDDGARPVMARIFMPALVRGPELFTATGLYGRIIDRAKAMEESGEALSAAVLIGNPFTDAPELGSQALVVTDGDEEGARKLADELAAMFWRHHEAMVAELDEPDAAIADAMARPGPLTFTDAADAPSSGASGDSNSILAKLVAAGYAGEALIPIVDAPAAGQAHQAGPGARLTLAIGGTIDPARFPPITIEVEVERLGDGEFIYEVSGMPAHAGPTAVLRHRNIRIVVLSRAVFLMDRAVFLAHGLDPKEAHITVVKSPGAVWRYFTFTRKNYVPDIPGATSANLKRLGHTICPRPMFPLDPDVRFEPRVEVFARWKGAAA